MAHDLEIDPDIRRARTLAAAFYADPASYARQLESVFARSWQVVPAPAPGPESGVAPFALLGGSLDEPLVLTRDGAGVLHCLSNVCTHRGNLVATEAGPCRGLRCSYHGRRFELDGTFRSMPAFEEACDFPSAADALPRLPLERWGPLLFTSLAPRVGFEDWIGPVRQRTEWLRPTAFVLDPAGSRDYEVAAHWALYCDNYLEGFHIPFVHPALTRALDATAYRTETFAWGSVQIGIARPGEPAFAPPEGHPDHGQSVGGYYFWLYPNLMLNFYPWGLSLNVVEPLGVDRTRVRYSSWVGDGSLRGKGAGAGLDRVELEDEAVVQQVQRGIRSRLYREGRYSPSMETGVHHFHRLLARELQGAEPR